MSDTDLVRELVHVRDAAPQAYHALLTANARARELVDPGLLAVAERRIAALLEPGVSDEPTALTPQEAAVVALTEQFVVFVAAINGDLRQPLESTFSPDELRTFVQALYVIDMLYRLRLTHRRVFAIGDGRLTPVPVVTRSDDADLRAKLRDLHADAMLLEAVDPETTELVRIRCGRHHDCAT